MLRKIFLPWLLFIPAILPQVVYPDLELTLQVTNAPSCTLKFELIPLGTVFCNDRYCDFEVYETSSYILTLVTDTTGNILCKDNGFEIRYCDQGNNRIIRGCAQSGAGVLSLRWGYYKLTIKQNEILKSYCYIDWRETGFPVNAGCNQGCTDNDITIRYDDNVHRLKFYNYGNPPYSDYGEDLFDGDIIIWADVKECPERDYAVFWYKGLVLKNHNGNPKLIWTPHPAFEVTYYHVFRAVAELPYNPKIPLNYYLIGIRDASTYEFIDPEFEIGGSEEYIAFYYVKAYNSGTQTYSSATYAVNTIGEFFPHKIGSDLKNEALLLEYNLNQNFPNPFNPTTTINYSIQKAGEVTLKLYDILGTEVASLVNENQEAGNYSIEFNASNLPSGIYVYRITSGNFVDTKKLILLK